MINTAIKIRAGLEYFTSRTFASHPCWCVVNMITPGAQYPWWNNPGLRVGFVPSLFNGQSELPWLWAPNQMHVPNIPQGPRTYGTGSHGLWTPTPAAWIQSTPGRKTCKACRIGGKTPGGLDARPGGGTSESGDRSPQAAPPPENHTSCCPSLEPPTRKKKPRLYTQPALSLRLRW